MKHLIYLFIAAVLFVGCGNNTTEKKPPAENSTSGTIRISVDESFQPVIQEQLKVFASSYPDAHIIAEYKPEAECLKDLQKDSTRMIIISRGLTPAESKYYSETFKLSPQWAQLAEDAVAVVVNKDASDSVFTFAEVQAMLNGSGKKEVNVALDGNSATSTVRYLMDTVLRKGSLSKNVTGAKNSADLINYIASTRDAVGFVGISWVTNPQNPQQEQALAKVKMALIECKSCEKDTYAKPSQQTIKFKQYPLVRGLYYVLKENWAGLGSGFVNFMSYERGQLIFSRALLVPVKMNFDRRVTNIKVTE
jgi:phosphate transport system substrate-binding protein